MSDDQDTYRVELERFDRQAIPSRWRRKTVEVEAPSARAAMRRAELENHGWRARGWPGVVEEEPA